MAYDWLSDWKKFKKDAAKPSLPYQHSFTPIQGYTGGGADGNVQPDMPVGIQPMAIHEGEYVIPADKVKAMGGPEAVHGLVNQLAMKDLEQRSGMPGYALGGLISRIGSTAKKIAGGSTLGKTASTVAKSVASPNATATPPTLQATTVAPGSQQVVKPPTITDPKPAMTIDEWNKQNAATAVGPSKGPIVPSTITESIRQTHSGGPTALGTSAQSLVGPNAFEMDAARSVGQDALNKMVASGTTREDLAKAGFNVTDEQWNQATATPSGGDDALGYGTQTLGDSALQSLKDQGYSLKDLRDQGYTVDDTQWNRVLAGGGTTDGTGTTGDTDEQGWRREGMTGLSLMAKGMSPYMERIAERQREQLAASQAARAAALGQSLRQRGISGGLASAEMAEGMRIQEAAMSDFAAQMGIDAAKRAEDATKTLASYALQGMQEERLQEAQQDKGFNTLWNQYQDALTNGQVDQAKAIYGQLQGKYPQYMSATPPNWDQIQSTVDDKESDVLTGNIADAITQNPGNRDQAFQLSSGDIQNYLSKNDPDWDSYTDKQKKDAVEEYFNEQWVNSDPVKSSLRTWKERNAEYFDTPEEAKIAEEWFYDAVQGDFIEYDTETGEFSLKDGAVMPWDNPKTFDTFLRNPDGTYQGGWNQELVDIYKDYHLTHGDSYKNPQDWLDAATIGFTKYDNWDDVKKYIDESTATKTGDDNKQPPPSDIPTITPTSFDAESASYVDASGNKTPIEEGSWFTINEAIHSNVQNVGSIPAGTYQLTTIEHEGIPVLVYKGDSGTYLADSLVSSNNRIMAKYPGSQERMGWLEELVDKYLSHKYQGVG